MTRIHLLLDENIWLGLASALRELGYDALHVIEADLRSTDDESLLRIAANENRAVLTNNVRHFAPLVVQWYTTGREHPGVLFTTHLPPSELLKQTRHVLENLSAEELRNTCRWLHEFQRP